MRYPMRFNAMRHRLLCSNTKRRFVQLGPGQGNYLENWINVDANFLTAKIDIWADISSKLPFRSESVEAFYSHHVIEHLPDCKLPALFREIFRCLKPGGVFRIGGPNGDTAAERFLACDYGWFSDFPDKRRSVGGRFANFLLCRGEHLTILTASYLQELATNAGFDDLTVCKPCSDTKFPSIFDHRVLAKEWESTPVHPHTLLVEGRKPQVIAEIGRIT